MTDRELYFVTHHRAAHAVTSLMLGHRVRRVSPTESIEEEDWGILDARMEDVAAVCAAGFAIERILLQTPEEAWARCKNDRSLLAAIYADRTGMALEDAALTERFYQGVDSSESLLRHSTIRQGIDLVASALAMRFRSGLGDLSYVQIEELIAPVVGVPRKSAEEVAV